MSQIEFIVVSNKCCVVNCNSTTESSVLHWFPPPDKNYYRYSQWVRATGLESIKTSQRICHKHFAFEDTIGKRLRKGCIPRMHLPAGMNMSICQCSYYYYSSY